MGKWARCLASSSRPIRLELLRAAQPSEPVDNARHWLCGLGLAVTMDHGVAAELLEREQSGPTLVRERLDLARYRSRRVVGGCLRSAFIEALYEDCSDLLAIVER